MRTKASATELAKFNMPVDCCCPGGELEEVAKLADFLACDDRSFVAGASYPIDGGALA